MYGKTSLQMVAARLQAARDQNKTEIDLDDIPPETTEKPEKTIEDLLAEILAEVKRSNKAPIAKIDSPWLTLTEAAAYLRFSPRYFREIAKQYQIPRHGPDRNRFNRFELDEWIDDPDRFKQISAKPARRKEGYKIHNIQIVKFLSD